MPASLVSREFLPLLPVFALRHYEFREDVEDRESTHTFRQMPQFRNFFGWLISGIYV
jgi:hypothetical protein